MKKYIESMYKILYEFSNPKETETNPYLKYTIDVIELLSNIIDIIFPPTYHECRAEINGKQFCCFLGNIPDASFHCKTLLTKSQYNKLTESIDILMNQLFLILQVCKSQDLQHNFYDDSKKTSVLRRFLEKNNCFVWC